MIDTGFTGFLTLPSVLVAELGLAFWGIGQATLADGAETSFPAYHGAVLWDGQLRHVQVDAVDAMPLVGMALLDGYDLYMRVAEGGQVAVRESA